jgi:hypothetical protein
MTWIRILLPPGGQLVERPMWLSETASLRRKLLSCLDLCMALLKLAALAEFESGPLSLMSSSLRLVDNLFFLNPL